MPPVENVALVLTQPVPNLLLNLDTPYLHGDVRRPVATLDSDSVSKLLAESTSVAGTGTVTLSGTPTAADVITIIIGGITINYTVSAGDQAGGLNTTAASLANAINIAAQAFVNATAAAAVVTLTARNKGIGGNAITVTASKTGVIATPTVVAFSGGTGQLTPQQNGSVVVGKTIFTFYAGKPIFPSVEIYNALVAAGIPVL